MNTSSVMTSPICALNDDVLRLIFSKNAKPEYEAIRNILAVSRVCHSWRTLALETPSLWASTLNINALTLLPEKGRQEIFRRTGGAPLSFAGDIRSWSYQQFLFKTVLHVYWPRIRRLDILIRPSLVETYDEGWCAIYQPAPYLEEFYIRFSTFYNEEPTDTSDAEDDEKEHVIHSPPGFFGGEAPLLRSFSCPSIHDFDLSAPWLVNLRHLLFGQGGKDEKMGIPLATFLGTLDNMKNLETLQISTAYLVVPDDPSLPPPTAHLPRLLNILLEPDYSLKGSDTLLMDICLLKHVRPAPGCGLRVRLRERSNFLPQTRDLLHESLAMHSKNWFDVGMGRAPLTLHLDKYLGIIIAHQFSDWDQGRRFSVTVQDANYDHLEYLLFVLDAFSSCKFSTITRLKLKLDKEVYWTNSHVQSDSSSPPCLISKYSKPTSRPWTQ